MKYEICKDCVYQLAFAMDHRKDDGAMVMNAHHTLGVRDLPKSA
jgi:hypothetical protein